MWGSVRRCACGSRGDWIRSCWRGERAESGERGGVETIRKIEDQAYSKLDETPERGGGAGEGGRAARLDVCKQA